MGGEYFSAKNIDISLFLCYNYKNNLGRRIMEELLKRLMSYARVAILLIISLILMVCGTIDHFYREIADFLCFHRPVPVDRIAHGHCFKL